MLGSARLAGGTAACWVVESVYPGWWVVPYIHHGGRGTYTPWEAYRRGIPPPYRIIVDFSLFLSGYSRVGEGYSLVIPVIPG